ncbi:alpha/beta-hydrolase [Aspergillus ambiguus]|uniref:alpha/beta hydrolase n=1 Tax=Aspergillus ambiguus TaxID=176160 RepID=UPI003CCE33EC
MSDLPTLVFIPGAWHRPTCYDKITKVLQNQHSLRCVSVTLPSTTGNPAATFKDDLDAARDAIVAETMHHRNAVVIAHSYGGMVANSAIKGFTLPEPGDITAPASPSPSQAAQPPKTTGHVIGLILIASGFTMTGLTFMDPFFGRPPPSWRVNNTTGYAELVASPREFFYHDLPDAEAEFWVSQLMPQSLKALFEGGEHTYSGWRDVPVWYIGTIEDRGLPVLAQRMAVGMAREMGGRVEHRELETSHSPFLSQPGVTAMLIWEAVGAFVGKPAGNETTMSRSDSAVVVPKSTIWQLSTWFRFGLPLAFGHILGRGILLYKGVKRLWGAGSI